jgi:hypothetical protein
MANSLSRTVNVSDSIIDMYLLFNQMVSDLLDKTQVNKSSWQNCCRAMESEQEMNCRTPQIFLKMINKI